MAGILDLSRMNDSGDLAGAVSEVAAVTDLNGRRVVTAVRTGDGRLRLISWGINTAGPVTRLGDSANQAGSASHLAIAKGSRHVAACRTGEGRLQLISWDVDGAGQITRRGDSGNEAGAATLIRILALSGDRFVTACRTGDGDLRIITWRLNANGSLTRVGDSGNAAGAVSDISLLDIPGDSGNRILTAVRTGDGRLRLIVWSVATSGSVSRLADSANLAGPADLIRTALDGFGNIVTAVRDGDGDLKLITWRVAAADGKVTRLADSGTQAGAIGDNSLVGFPNGVVSAVRTGSGDLRLIAWQTSSSGTILRRGDSRNQAGEASRIVLLRGEGVADASGHSVTMVAAVRTGMGRLRLITWGPTCVVVHFKTLIAPSTGVQNFINTQHNALQQLFASVGITSGLGTTEDLSGNASLANLRDLEVGKCLMGSPTSEQVTLFGFRNNAGPTDLVIYVVRTLVGGSGNFVGCAVHPTGQPGAAIVQSGANWLLAHEAGHVLGLGHVSTTPTSNSDFLMWPNIGWTNVPPNISAAEMSTMVSSTFTNAC